MSHLGMCGAPRIAVHIHIQIEAGERLRYRDGAAEGGNGTGPR
jgi:hypothetical protein